MKSAFSHNMKKARLHLRLTQDAAAAIIGISRSNIGSYEEGRAAPRFDHLIKICDGYGIKDLYSFIANKDFSFTSENNVVKQKSLIEQKYHLMSPNIKKAVNVLLGLN